MSAVAASGSSGSPDQPAASQAAGDSPALVAERNDRASASEIEASRTAFDGDVSASDAREIIGNQAPSLIAPDAIVPPAEDVVRPLAQTALQMKGKDGGPGGVMQSNLPVAVETQKTEDNQRGLELADIDWRRAGDRIEVKRPTVPVSLPLEAGGTLKFGDLGATLAPGAEDTTASVTGETVTYPNVETDRDLVVRSTTVGVEALWTLRSPDADRVIKVPIQVPAGGKLAKLPTGGIDVRNADDETVGSMGATSAVDADKKNVPVDVDVDGNTVVITVEPAADQTQWPIVVDPIFTARWDAGSANDNGDLANWETRKIRTTNPFVLNKLSGGPSAGTFGGLLITGPGDTTPTKYATNDYGMFRRFAPGNPDVGATSPEHAWWYRFDVGDLAYNNNGGAYSFDPKGGAMIQNNNGSAQPSKYQLQNPNANAAQNYSGATYSATVNDGPFQGFPNGTKTGAAIYTGTNGSDNGINNQNHIATTKSPDNQVTLSIIDSGTWGAQRRPTSQLLMGWYRLYASDNVAPNLTTATPQGSMAWTDTPPTTVSGVKATDNGVGVQRVGVARVIVPNGPDSNWTDFSDEDCPTTARKECTFATPVRDYDLGSLPEGRTNYKLAAIDAGGQITSQDLPFAVDRSAPTVALTGSLYSDRDSTIAAGASNTRSLTINAADGDAAGGAVAARSGVANVEIFVDGESVFSSNQTASGDNASLSATWTPDPAQFGPGDHMVEVAATDRLGHVNNEQTFTVHGTAENGTVDGELDEGNNGDADANDPVSAAPDNSSDTALAGTTTPDSDDPIASLFDSPTQSANRSGAGPTVPSRHHYQIGTEKGWVTVRNNVHQFFIGSGHGYNSNPGWTFDSSRADPNGKGEFGYIYGQYKYCGWLNTNASDPADHGTYQPHCGGADHIPVKRIAGLINCDQCNGGTYLQITKYVTAYRNLRPFSPNHDPENPAETYGPGQFVKWRYVTPDGKWVAINDGNIPSGSNWAFVPRSAFSGTSKSALCAGHGSPRRVLDPGHLDQHWAPVCTIH